MDIKQRDIEKCAICGKGVMHSGQPTFLIFEVKTMIINIGAIQRQHGLELMLGGVAPLAAVMGPDEDMAKEMSSVKKWICMDCSMEKIMPIQLSEEIDDEDDKDDF